MVRNLSILKKEVEKPEKVSNNNNNLVTPYRYQTITFETLGYSGASVDVRPYGIAKVK